MAGEVRIDFEARQDISDAVEKIDSSLDRLKQSLGSLSTVSEVTDSTAEQLEDSLDDVGDEANQATVSLSSLMAASAGLQAAFAGIDDDMDFDVPDEAIEDGAVSLHKLRDAWLESADDMDDDHPFKRIARTAPAAMKIDEKDVEKEFKEAQARFRDIRDSSEQVKIPIGGEDNLTGDVRNAIREAQAAGKITLDIDVDAEGIKEKVETAVEEAEAAARDISVNLDIPLSSFERIEKETSTTTNAIERSDASEIEIDLDFDYSSAEGVQKQIRRWSERVENDFGYSTIDIDVNLDFQDLLEQQKELKGILETMEAVNEIDIDVDMDASDDIIELVTLLGTLSEAQSEAFQTAVAAKSAANGIDEMGDEAREAAGEMGFFATAASMASLNTTALSLNVGAFNIALANLATQIPILIGLLGTLGTALGGVAGAAGLAAVGFGGIFAGGFLAETQRVQEEFAGIEDRAQAMQAILESLMESFSQAIEPLTQAAEEADIFFRVINGLLETVNVFAQGIADSMEIAGEQLNNFVETGKNLGIIDDAMSDSEIDDQIMSLSEFFDEMGRIWEENVGDIVAATQIMSAYLLPILTDILDYFLSGFDEMILFVTKFTHSLQTLGPALKGVIDFAQQLIELTSTVLQGIVPVLVGLISVATEVARVLNSLDSQIVSNIAGMLLMAKVVGGLVGLLGTLTSTVWALTLGLASERLAMVYSALATEVAAGKMSRLKAVKIGLIWTTYALQDALSKEGLIRMWNNSLIGKSIGLLAKYIGSLWGSVYAKYANATASIAQAGSLSAAIIAKYNDIAATNAQTASLWGAVSGLLSYAASALVGAAASWTLLAPLLPIAAALIAIAAAGAIAVGVLANMDSVTSGLKSALASIKEGLSMILDVLLGVFIDVWNSLMDAWAGVMAVVNPLIDAFERVASALGLASGEGGAMSAVFAVLAASIKAAFLPIQLLFDVLGKLTWLIGMLLGFIIELIVGGIEWFVNEMGRMIDRIDKLTAGVQSLIGGVRDAGSSIQWLGDMVEWLRGIWMQMEEVLMNPFKAALDGIEWFVNESIRALNRIASLSNKYLGTDIDKIDYEMDLKQPEDAGGKLSREDVVSKDAEKAENEVPGKQAPNFNYNEENINNVAQEINADPEEKESLRRVVKDAMEEANAMHRRHQGHGG